MAEIGTQPTIRVRGEAVLRAEPDEALLWITITAIMDAPGPALADVTARSITLGAMLDELGIEKAHRTTTGITVYEEFDHTAQRRRSVGHRALTQVLVRLGDPEPLGALISRAAGELAARIEGPRWQIAPDNPIRLEVARQAARDAEGKARAYAEGIGCALGRPLRVAEPEGPMAMVRRGLRPMAPGAEAVPVDPGEQEVSATIDVTFALESGSSGE